MSSLAQFAVLLSNFWWFHFSKFLNRFSQKIAAIYLDGFYLQAWPAIGALSVPTVFIIGLFIGWFHFANGEYYTYSETYTYSLVVMAVLLILSNFSAGLGMWLFIGYVIGDFFLYDKHAYVTTWNDLILNRTALILVYILLAQLLIFFPMISSWLRKQTLDKFNLSGKFRVIINTIVQAALQGILVYIWTLQVPTLIRPLYTWQGYQPPTEAIQPLQESGYWLILIAILIGAARMLLLYKAFQKPMMVSKLEDLMLVFSQSSQSNFRTPNSLSIPLQAGFMTFLLSGILSNWIEALIIFTLSCLILVGRKVLVSKMKKFVRLITRVPLIIRLSICAGISYYIGSLIITSQWDYQSTFVPILIAIIISLAISNIIAIAGQNNSDTELSTEKVK
jgi:hypothetical protein